MLGVYVRHGEMEMDKNPGLEETKSPKKRWPGVPPGSPEASYSGDKLTRLPPVSNLASLQLSEVRRDSPKEQELRNPWPFMHACLFKNTFLWNVEWHCRMQNVSFRWSDVTWMFTLESQRNHHRKSCSRQDALSSGDCSTTQPSQFNLTHSFQVRTVERSAGTPHPRQWP